MVIIADGRGYRALSPRCNGSGQRSIFSRPLTTQHNKHGIRSPTAGQRYKMNSTSYLDTKLGLIFRPQDKKMLKQATPFKMLSFTEIFCQ